MLLVQDMLQNNIDLNQNIVFQNGGSAETFPLIWGQTSIEDLEEKWQKIDIILAADVIYHRELFEPLLNTLHELGK